MSAVDVSALADPVWELIKAIAGVNAFDGEIVDENGNRVEPPADPDGRVHAYAVYYPSAGWAHALLACGGTDSLDWTFQVTCVGGDRTRALWCVERVRGALSGTAIDVAGQQLVIREETNAGELRRDDKFTPTRLYAPLIFAVNA